MVSVRSLFFLTFYEKILRVFKIILYYYYPQLSKLSLLWFLWASELSCCTNHDWIYVSRKDSYSCLSSTCLYSWHIWMNRSIVFLSEFWVWMGWSWNLPYSATPFYYGALVCVVCCISGIWIYLYHEW